MDKVLEKYYEYLKYELNYSDNTISDYKLHILKYKEYLDKIDLTLLTLEVTIFIFLLPLITIKAKENKPIIMK